MTKYQHIPSRENCPFLPIAHHVMRPSEARAARDTGSDDSYYIAALTCAQSLWLEGKPAQSILQLNHALSLRLPDHSPALIQWQLPYRAKIWILKNRLHTEFLGNPVRHYQHLATRVSGQRRELRSWRAWACFHLAEQNLPSKEFPRDERQIKNEEINIPSWGEVTLQISSKSSDKEAQLLHQILT